MSTRKKVEKEDKRSEGEKGRKNKRVST